MKNEIIEIERRMLEGKARIADLECQLKASKQQDKHLFVAAVACYGGLVVYTFWPEITAFIAILG